MNKILITKKEQPHNEQSTLHLTYQNANQMLPMLRSDHFKEIILADSAQVELKDLKFLIQLTRLLKPDGSVTVKDGQKQEINTLLSKLNLHQGEPSTEGTRFLKTKPQPKAEEKKSTLSIGFKSNQNEQLIDESQLLKGENLEINKKKAEKCQTKPRACANCNCGRKQTQKPIPKEQLIKNINEGQPVSGCGKCYYGDSFRCGTCPYKGLPAFKPGDKLKLTEQGGVTLEQAGTTVSATGKVKLEL